MCATGVGGNTTYDLFKLEACFLNVLRIPGRLSIHKLVVGVEHYNDSCEVMKSDVYLVR
jgi:hypothetical protein